MYPGQQLLVPLPNGQQMSATIPAGVGPGGSFNVTVPVEDLYAQQLMHTKGACCGACAEKKEVITFDEHMDRMKNKEVLHALAKKLHISEQGRLFKYIVNVLESNPFFGIFFHEKGGAFNTKEQVAAFIGFTAISWAVGFWTAGIFLLPVDAEWDCYHNGFTGCGGWEPTITAFNGTNTTQSRVEICHDWLRSVDANITLTCANPLMLVDEAIDCIGTGSQSWDVFILEGIAATMYQYMLGGSLVSYWLKKKETYMNIFAYSFVLLEIYFLVQFQARFYGLSGCEQYGNARNTRSHIWFSVVSNFFYQVCVVL
jgi:hypothetical protein